MSLFKPPHKPILRTVSFRREVATKTDGGVLMEFDGAIYRVDAGDFSRALATGAAVVVTRVTDK